MARKQTRETKYDNMSVLGENYIPSTLPGETAVYPHRFASWFERPRHDQPFEYKRPFKRQWGNEEQCQCVSSPKKFVSEEVVASHLQQLNLASNNTPHSPPATITNTTATTTVLPSSQSPIHSHSLSSSPLLSVAFLSSSADLLASAAQSCPLSMKTVASCPRSLETNKDDMTCDDRVIDTTSDVSFSQSIQSSSSSTYSGADISAQLSHVTNPALPSTQSGTLNSSDVRMNSDEMDDRFYQCMRTSLGHNKRPACVLDECEESERIEIANGEGGGKQLLSVGPYTKRSKVDVRVTTTTSDFMNCDTLPLSFSLPHNQLQQVISDESSQCSSTDSDSLYSNETSDSKTLETVVLEDGSDSSDGGTEPGPERPLSLWLSPELQALSSSRVQEPVLLPPAILEKFHTPKGMELVPWVGGASVLAKVEEKRQQSSHTDPSPPMENSGEESQMQAQTRTESEQQQEWTSQDNLNDVTMES